MTEFYRVFPYDPSAAPREPGGALFVPEPGEGRIANPTLYRELYLAGSPQAAVAERFGRLARWRRATFAPHHQPPFAMAHLRLPRERVCNLDDTAALVAFGIAKPTDVVSDDRDVTREWARRIFDTHEYDGLCWWSHYYPRYRIYGIWEASLFVLAEPPSVLTIDSPVVREAAKDIVRQRIDA